MSTFWVKNGNLKKIWGDFRWFNEDLDKGKEDQTCRWKRVARYISYVEIDQDYVGPNLDQMTNF